MYLEKSLNLVKVLEKYLIFLIRSWKVIEIELVICLCLIPFLEIKWFCWEKFFHSQLIPSDNNRTHGNMYMEWNWIIVAPIICILQSWSCGISPNMSLEVMWQVVTVSVFSEVFFDFPFISSTSQWWENEHSIVNS